MKAPEMSPRVSRRRFLAGLAGVGSTVGALSLLPLAGGLGRVQAETIRFDTARLAIHGDQGPSRLTVEIAEHPAQRARGLMGRERLERDSGMLFVYDRPQSPESGFWMYRTLIPLDIAFIDREGRIGAIHRMTPCGSDTPGECRAYRAGVAYVAALEVNAGYFAERGIGLGDCVSLPIGAGRAEASPDGCHP